MQNQSKNFKNHEIKGILPDGSTYLKTGVKRKRFNDEFKDDEQHLINQELINYEKYLYFLKEIEGKDDFEND